MKTQMKLLAASLPLTLTLALALPVNAKPPSEKHHEHVIEALELDDGRAEEVRQIMQSYHEQKRALHREVREQMKALHADKQERLGKVLTEEEMAKLKEMKAERHKEADGRKGHHDKKWHKHHSE